MTTRKTNKTDSKQERLQAVRQMLEEWQVDGLLIGSPHNRRWLSGFTGSAGWLLITAAQACLATDSRYWEQATQQAPHFDLFRQQRTAASFQSFVTSAGIRQIGIEANHVTLAQMDTFADIDGIDWRPLSPTVESLREIKSEEELATLRAAAAITDEVMGQVHQIARPGMSEQALAWELEQRLRNAGATRLAFNIIVASGPNAALAHHRPGERLLQANEPFLIDMGARLNGYHSDLTRSFYLGDQPDARFWEIYNLVLKAETNALEKTRPGMTGQEADALARSVIEAAGYGDQFGHGLGHGVGLEIHESPSLSPRATEQVLKPNMTMTIEPGVYLPGWGGVRIEDFVVVTEEGIDRLSHCPQEPLVPLN